MGSLRKKALVALGFAALALVIVQPASSGDSGDAAVEMPSFGAEDGSAFLAKPSNPASVELTQTGDQETPQPKPKHPGVIFEQPPDDVQKLKEQVIELQNKGELGFRKVVACTAVEGYGMYSPIEESGPRPSKLILYFEPCNVSTLVSGDRFIIDLSVDLVLTDSSGKVIGSAPTKKLNRVSYSPIFDIHYAPALSLKELANRDVTLRISLRDNIKNRTVTRSYRINIHSSGQKFLDRI
jgi:hypothetical protein